MSTCPSREIVFGIMLWLLASCLHAQDRLSAGPVEFLKYDETGSWKTWTDGRLRIRIPEKWAIAIDARSLDHPQGRSAQREPTGDRTWKYRVIHSDQESIVLTITLVRGGPEFIKCFCTSRDHYQFTVENGVKIWAVGLRDGKLRTFKAATSTMRLDIHKALPETNPDLVRYVLETARPIEPGQAVR